MTAVDERPVLVTGGAGFIGCNLVDRLAASGRPVIVLDNLARPGAERNADWLLARHGAAVTFGRADIRDRAAVEAAVAQASAVFHLAAQVAVTTSLVDPMHDFAVNVEGAVVLLEALRNAGRSTPLIFASTNKVYGDLADVALVREATGYAPRDPAVRKSGVSEQRPLAFCTPYGCSKGAADQYVLDYARSFGLRTAVLRMSCIYGPRQMGTEDQGWVAHFLIRALRGEPITLYGDGFQVRDILYIDDAVDAYLAALAQIDSIAGRAFNLGGGPANAVSLNQLLAYLESRLDRRIAVQTEPWRKGDQRYYVSDCGSILADLALNPPLPWQEGVQRLIDWLQTAPDSPLAAPARAEAAE